MTKRANGLGSLYKVTTVSGVRWQASETIGKTADGKLIRITGTGRTQAEAEKRQKLNERKYWATIDNKHHASKASLRKKDLHYSVRHMLEDWFESLDASAYTPATYRGYQHKIELHLAPPPFGNITLGSLTSANIRHQFQDVLPRKVKTKGKGKGVEPLLSTKSVGNIWTVFSMAIKWALDEEILAKDPRGANTRPKVSRTDQALALRRQMEFAKTYWKPGKVLKHIEGREDEAQWLIQILLACRQSEKLGLEWNSFNNLFSTKKGITPTVVFNQQLERNQVFHGCGLRNARTLMFPCGFKNANKCPQKTGDSGYHITPSTKTLAGMREIPLLPELVAVMREHKKRQDEWKALPTWQSPAGLENLVFTTHTGQPMRQQDDTKAWRKLCAELNLGELRGHTARHFAATVMAAKGYPVTTIAQIIGHGSEDITRLIYTHPDTESMLAAMGGYMDKLKRR